MVASGRPTGAGRVRDTGTPAPRGAPRGFSLLELLLVMALIAATGLLAAGVLSGGFDRMALRSGAKEMAAQLRARAHAIATGSRSGSPSTRRRAPGRA